MHLFPFSFIFFKNTIPIVGLTSVLMLVMFHGPHIRGTQVHVPTPQIATTTPSLSNFWVYFATVGSHLILIEGTANCFKTSTVFATVSGDGRVTVFDLSTDKYTPVCRLLSTITGIM